MGTVRQKCKYCGKWLSRDEDTPEDELRGDVCKAIHEERGLDGKALLEHRRSQSVAEIPVVESGPFKGQKWLKLATFKIILPKAGIPVSRIVDAIGKDRSLDGPVDPRFRVVYVGRPRYIHPWCASSEGLEFLRNLKVGKSLPLVEEAAKMGAKTSPKPRKSVTPVAQLEAELQP